MGRTEDIAAVLFENRHLFLDLRQDRIRFAPVHRIDTAVKHQLIAVFFLNTFCVHAGLDLQRIQAVDTGVQNIRKQAHDIAAGMEPGINTSVMSPFHRPLMKGLHDLAVHGR